MAVAAAAYRTPRSLAAALAVVLTSHPLTAQSRTSAPVTVAGHLLRVRDADTTFLAGQWVVAHHVNEREQGPLDSLRTDVAGRFRFQLRPTDSTDVFVVSSRHQGIGYFSEPISATGTAMPLVLVVFDTSATGVPLQVGIRHVVVTAEQNRRRVLDIFQVENAGGATRVGRDSSVAVWTTRLPEGAESPQPGEGDVTASAIRFNGGRVEVMAPFPPGLKQVVVTYTLASGARTLAIPIDHPTERLEVLLEDSTATVSDELTPDEPVSIDRRTFRRFTADSLAPGAMPRVTLAGLASPARDFTWLVVVIVALVLAGAGTWLMVMRRAGAAPVDPGLAAESDGRLTAMAAALDERFAGRQADTPADAWATYQQRRAALQAELARRVARR